MRRAWLLRLLGGFAALLAAAARAPDGCGVPTRLSFAELRNEYKNQNFFPVGKTAEYTCRPGYRRHPGIRPTIMCLKNGRWSEASEFCKKKSCGHPGEPENGQANVTDIFFGSTVHFVCEEGHRLIGQSYRRCEISGARVDWSGDVPICERIPCLPPPDIANGRHTGVLMDDFSYGSAVTYTCDNGLRLTGEASIHCTTKDGVNGEWSERPPRCGDVRCPVPQILNGRRVSGDRAVYSYKDNVTFECNPGFTMKGPSLSQCQTDETWDPPVPVCEQAQRCPPPPAIAHGKPSVQARDVFTSGMSVNYQCDPGYSFLGEASLHCTASGAWGRPLPQCEAKCVSPVVENGRTNGVQLAYGPRDVVLFECDPGYTLSGSPESQCQDDGSWDPPIPVCERSSEVFCITPDLPNGRKVAGRRPVYRPRDTVRFECDPGYTLNDSRPIQCREDRTWDPPVPVCLQDKYGCGVPTRLGFAELRSEYKNHSYFPVGKTIHYTCLPGYTRHPKIKANVTCLENGSWSEALEFCKKKSCGHPGEPENGRVIATDIVFGSTVNFTCEVGHRLIGQSYRRCEISGARVDWSGDVPICERIPCLPPPDIANGRHTGVLMDDFSYGSAVTYTCDNGLRLTGEASIHCTTKDGVNGEWSERPPRCGDVRCPVPQILNGRRVSGDRAVYSYKDNVTFECNPGFTMKGPSLSQCQTDETWDPPVPVCEQAQRCPPPPAIAHGKPSVQARDVFTSGMSVNYQCDPGYSFLGEASLHCTASGAWGRPLPQCEAKCVSPVVENGRTNGVQLAYGPRDVVLFECDPGYTLSGSPESQCQDDGSWDPPIPVCERSSEVFCITPDLPNGRKVAGRRPVYRPRDTVRFECDPGYTLNDSRPIQCREDRTWDPPVPVCLQDKYGCGVPTRLGFAELRSEYKNHSYFPVGKTIHYTCLPGYTRHPKIKANVTCLENGSWSEALEFCKKKSCGHPGEPENGRVIATDIVFGSTVNFTCEVGHRLIGQSYRRCEISGARVDWSGDVPICERIPCLPPPDIANGRHTGVLMKDFFYGSAVTYTCDNGFQLTGEASIHCTTKDGVNGEWSERPPRCGDVRCPVPQILNGRRVSGDRAVYSYKDNVTFECNPGFTMKGPSLSQCQTDETWDPPVPVCEQAQRCPPPPAIAHGKPSVQAWDVFTSGMSVNYQCDPGYSFLGEASLRCTASGAWGRPLPQCEAKCVSPVVENGRTNGVQLAYGPRDVVLFECDPGYTLSGSPESQCQDDGSWDPPIPVCERSSEVFCITPDLPNGRKVAGRRPVYRPRDTVRFECDPGYTLNDSRPIQCREDRTWDPPVPVCLQDKYGCGVPTRLGFAELRSEYKNHSYFPVGKTIHYTCLPGYTRHPKIKANVTCLENGSWSEALEFCKKKSCGHPGEPENGRVIATDIVFGSTVNFTCEVGHRLIGQSYRRCEISGARVDWSGDVPICERIPCLPPPDIANGRHTGVLMKDFFYGSAVTYTCDNGFQLTGEASIHCTTKDGVNGEWSERPPRCGDVRCPVPQILNGRRVSGDRAVYSYKDNVTFECNPGFTMKGPSLSQCQTDETWDPPVPVCEQAQRCPPPPAIAHGKPSVQAWDVFTSGMSVNYQCDPGYSFLGEASLHCTASGAWGRPLPQCEAKCVSPVIENGRTNGVQLAYGPRDVVLFECDPGYTLSGSPETQCQDDGSWDPLIAVCERRLRCPSPPIIDHGKPSSLALAVFTSGMSVNYSCEPGYSLSSQASIYCTASGTWSPLPPQCEALQCAPPSAITSGKLSGQDLEIFITGTSLNYSCKLEIKCAFPEVQGGRKAVVGTTYRFGTNVTLECDNGYVLEGSSLIQCQHDFTWDPPVPVCKPTSLTSYDFISEVLGILGGVLLLLLIITIIWKIMSKQNTGYYYTHENNMCHVPLTHLIEQKSSFAPYQLPV